jgi:hypothetical protein
VIIGQLWDITLNGYAWGQNLIMYSLAFLLTVVGLNKIDELITRRRNANKNKS